MLNLKLDHPLPTSGKDKPPRIHRDGPGEGAMSLPSVQPRQWVNFVFPTCYYKTVRYFFTVPILKYCEVEGFLGPSQGQ